MTLVDTALRVETADAAPRLRSFGWRSDIQALRGLAVLLVVIDHARFPYLPGGFLGVDIFFVISGFMITGIIIDEIDARTFSFGAFYARRIRRLLPAAYATIIVTVAVAPFLLDPYEFSNLATQVIGAFSFTINFVLWRQVDYFNSGAALKPLLHMWSLSIEEQFYIALPFVLLLCPKRLRAACLSVLVLCSAVLCFYFVQRSPSAAFYFLPFRAWEFGIGALSAVAVRRYAGLWNTGPFVRAGFVAILVAVPFFADERGHPGIVAGIVCIATALLMVTGGPRQRWSPIAPFVWLGDRSYSLYLVHWPVMAFANNVFIAPVPGLVDGLLLLVCALWMELQYRFVERPFRTIDLNRRNKAVLLLVPLLVSLATLGWTWRPDVRGVAFRADNAGFGVECNYKALFQAKPSCQNSVAPHTMVWGDSYAMHLVGALESTLPSGLIQATKTVCGPFLGIAPVNGAQYPEAWARQCIAFNQSVLAYLLRHADIRTVVMSSSLVQYLPDGEAAPWKMLVATDHGDELRPLDADAMLAALSRTVDALHAIGKRVAFVAPPPGTGLDIGRCLSRIEAGVPSVGAQSNCTFDRRTYESMRKPVLAFLDAAQEHKIVDVVSFDAFLCGEGTCRTRLDDVDLYRDTGHLSVDGSALLGRKMDLGRLVERAAR